MNAIRDYLQMIQRDLSSGIATEHTYRPALKDLIEQMSLNVVATNEPSHVSCGAPDFVVTQRPRMSGVIVGYIECKDVGANLNAIERSQQLKRYLGSLDNLILTDYLEFRWYAGGSLVRTARIAQIDGSGKIQKIRDGEADVTSLIGDFLGHRPDPVRNPKDLAERMARLTHLIRDIIVESFEKNIASEVLKGWRQAFAQVLVADLEQPEKTGEFADMFAQTLAYGLFSARIMDTTPDDFSRQEAQRLIPKTNPFLRDFFYQVSGPQMEDEAFGPFVENLVTVLRYTDIEAVLADFGKRTKQEDPVVHFYETFLAAYDPKLRESRGVYYTPEPVVSYIVRSVDHLLKTRFNLPQGLADTSKITIPNRDHSLVVKGTREMRKTTESHKVLVLDPAAGTGTFLYAVIDYIRQNFMESGNAGMWPGYVREHLLPRLFGFELLMAPYAVAHFKLALQLAGHDLPEDKRKNWAYDFQSDERVQVYLTNTLEGAHEDTGLPLFTQFLARETQAANLVKSGLPIMVVLGNPPYSGHSSNQGAWIGDLLRGKLPNNEKTESYYEVDGKPLGERNPKWLQDDYVKFIRWGQWRIEQSGGGILAFISNHGYLDNPTFRGMRQSLMSTFDEIFVLNLHGNTKKKEVAPDGSADENVFDIQQGVAIGLFVKYQENNPLARGVGKRGVWQTDLWGKRNEKYSWLFENDVFSTKWEKLEPQKPFRLFLQRDRKLETEYKDGWSVQELFNNSLLGFQTHRDKVAIDFNIDVLLEKVTKFLGKKPPIDLWEYYCRVVDYRPFDYRFAYLEKTVTDRPRLNVTEHLFKENIALNLVRQTRAQAWAHSLVSRNPTPAVYLEIKDGSSIFSLYSYQQMDDKQSQKKLFDTSPWSVDELGRVPNLIPEFVYAIEKKLGMGFEFPKVRSIGKERKKFGPEDIFSYIYSIFHSPTYRERYMEFLKMDFPRVPLTSDVDLFWELVDLGGELVGLHLLEADKVKAFITRYPIPGDNEVARGYPKYKADHQRIYINPEQFFEEVPAEVWEFQVGGYQVLDKWLKDRRGRMLSYDDLNHYQQVVVALKETIRLMDAIDEAIGEWPIE